MSLNVDIDSKEDWQLIHTPRQIMKVHDFISKLLKPIFLQFIAFNEARKTNKVIIESFTQLDP